MAQAIDNGIILKYPDSPCPVFNPCIFTLTGAMARTRVFISNGTQSYRAVYQTPGGGVLDLREFMQSFFADMDLSQEFANLTDIKVSELGKTVNLTLFALDTDGTTLAQFNVSVSCVWGALKPSEEYGGLRTIRWFTHFPLTLSIYAPQNGSIVYDTDPMSIPEPTPTLVNVLIENDPSDGHGFDVDRTYQRQGHTVRVTEYTIIPDDHDEGIYLRWIDRHGLWRHWLFKKGDPTVTAASRFGLWNRNDYGKYDAGNGYVGGKGWQGDAGRRQSYTRNDVQPLCAPLVTQEVFDMLQDITTSPVVDMFLGYGTLNRPNWTAVTVEAGSYTKDWKKPEQDFVFNLIMPETHTQTL